MFMRGLSTANLLDIWEQGMVQSPIQQALLLLAAACPEKTLEELAQLSLGQRDALLLQLREQTFGGQLTSVATCPACSERSELNFNIIDIRAAPGQAPFERLSLSLNGYDIEFHLPNSLDVAAIANQSDPVTARFSLLKQCLEQIHHQGQEQSLEQLPTSIIEAVETRMAEADPQADIQLDLQCPVCQHVWQVAFDIVSFFWSEIHTWAQRTFYEVHLLASAYGWREADILALSAQRRYLYLEMIRQ